MSVSLLYVCLDGLGDDPIPELDGRTPLEAAATPVLDGMAQRGASGSGSGGGLWSTVLWCSSQPPEEPGWQPAR